MKSKLLFHIFVLSFSFSIAQIKYPFKTFNEFRTKLDSVANIEDETRRSNSIGALWDTLKAHQKIPFTLDDSVAFLYKGSAGSVIWAGGFNGWDPNKGGFNGTRGCCHCDPASGGSQ